MLENHISADSRYIENNKGSGKVVISKDSGQKLVQFLARFYLKFNLGKSTCFKVISQAFLYDAKVWSDTVEKPCFDRGNEFAD